MNEEMIKQVANQLGKSEGQVTSVLNMLKEGNTVPFIARYRKEATGALNEDEIREIEKVYDYAVNLNTRKDDVIRLIEEKGMMNDNLKKDILACTKLSEVEDLYRPFKEKKKTRATVAKAKGLEPLSDWIWKLPRFGSLEEEAKKYKNFSLIEKHYAKNALKVCTFWMKEFRKLENKDKFYKFACNYLEKFGLRGKFCIKVFFNNLIDILQNKN